MLQKGFLGEGVWLERAGFCVCVFQRAESGWKEVLLPSVYKQAGFFALDGPVCSNRFCRFGGQAWLKSRRAWARGENTVLPYLVVCRLWFPKSLNTKRKLGVEPKSLLQFLSIPRFLFQCREEKQRQWEGGIHPRPHRLPKGDPHGWAHLALRAKLDINALLVFLIEILLFLQMTAGRARHFFSLYPHHIDCEVKEAKGAVLTWS